MSYSSNTIGIILSGMLDDGTSGMRAIKRSGGTCVVQDPNEAEYPEMPLSIINNMEADHVVVLEEIGSLIAKIVKQKKGRKKRSLQMLSGIENSGKDSRFHRYCRENR